jgi:hypothetical protein
MSRTASDLPASKSSVDLSRRRHPARSEPRRDGRRAKAPSAFCSPGALASLTLSVLLTCLLASPAAATISLTLDRPLDGDVLVSPVTISAEASTDAPGAQLTNWQVFVDGVTAYGTSGPAGTMTTRLTLGDGAHSIIVTAQDSTGDSATATVTLTIGVCSGFTVSLDSPGGGTETSPVHFAATAASCHRVIGFAIFADDRTIFEQRGLRSVDTSIELQAGTHNIEVRAWDSTGAIAKSTPISIEVEPKPPAKPPAAKTPPASPPAKTQPVPAAPPP